MTFDIRDLDDKLEQEMERQVTLSKESRCRSYEPRLPACRRKMSCGDGRSPTDSWNFQLPQRQVISWADLICCLPCLEILVGELKDKAFLRKQ